MEPNAMEQYIGLLVQVPLVGIFIWFTLRIVDRFMASLDKRDTQWQAFLEEQRKLSSESIASMAARFGDEIKEVSREVASLRGVLLAHDARSQERQNRGDR